MSAPWGSGEWNCGAGFAQRLNGKLTISLNISHNFWPVLTENDIDLVAASLLTEKNMSHILGAFSLAVDVDNVKVLLPGSVNRVSFPLHLLVPWLVSSAIKMRVTFSVCMSGRWGCEASPQMPPYLLP